MCFVVDGAETDRLTDQDLFWRGQWLESSGKPTLHPVQETGIPGKQKAHLSVTDLVSDVNRKCWTDPDDDCQYIIIIIRY